MQVALIVQLSIAMLARELAGGLPLGAPWGAAIALAGPGIVLALGHLAARRALRGMDRREAGAAERMFAFTGRAGWIGAACMGLAASTALPAAIPEPFGGALAAVYLMACGIGAILAAYWSAWLIEARIREAAIMRILDTARPLHGIPTRGAYVVAQARAGLVPVIAPLVVPIACGEIAAAVARARAPEYEIAAQFGGGILGVLVLFLLIPLIIPPLLGLERLPQGELRDDLEELARGAGIGMREIWVWPTDGLVANAGVMGVFPGLRCVMLSDALVEGVPRQQVLAVMAHELGHVARRHLAWMLPILLACWWIGWLVADPLAQAAYDGLGGGAGAEAADDAGSVAQALSLLRDAGMVVIGMLIFGFVSRRLERQADTYAVQLLSAREESAEATLAAVTAMTGALSSVAYLNHVPVARSSWRHGSIAWRQEYLRGLIGRPHARLPIDAFVRAVCAVALVLTASMVVLVFILRRGA